MLNLMPEQSFNELWSFDQTPPAKTACDTRTPSSTFVAKP